MRHRATSLVIFAASLSGCATIYSEPTQPVTFITTCANSTKVIAAQCQISTPKGTRSITTPGVIELSRTDAKVEVICTSANAAVGQTDVKPSDSLIWATNFVPFAIFYGGFITGIVGSVVDSATGASNDFPKSVTVALNCERPVGD